MNSEEKRAELAQLAYDCCRDKLKIEKNIEVCNETFEMCIADMPEHHKNTARKRGFLRTYHNSFWIKNSDGHGKTYHKGVIYIINEDAEVNKKYCLWESDGNLESELFRRVKILGHRIVSIGSTDGETCVVMIPQRFNFDD